MTVKKNGNYIEDPAEYCAGDDPKNTDDNENVILLDKSLNDTVDCPNDVKRGNAKNKLEDHGEIVDCLD